MLIIYKPETGMIEQAIHHGSFDLLEPKYRELGYSTLRAPGNAAPTHLLYVVDGKLTPRPELAVTATEAQIAFSPITAEVVITHANVEVAKEQVTDGVIEFDATHPGDYQVDINPPFPHLPARLIMKVAS